ncbi:MAG: helix-turn-helix domain-containing protein, partial [Thermodesulforhabdaceae bacterium]
MRKIILTHKIRLCPNRAQEELLKQAVGVA